EEQTVHDVRERVGIDEALRLLGAPDVAFPPAEPAVGTEQQAAHPKLGRDGQCQYRNDNQYERPGGSQRRSQLWATRCNMCAQTAPAAVARRASRRAPERRERGWGPASTDKWGNGATRKCGNGTGGSEERRGG